MDTATPAQSQPPAPASTPPRERLSYSIHEAAELLGVDYFSVYRLIQRKKLLPRPFQWNGCRFGLTFFVDLVFRFSPGERRKNLIRPVGAV